MAFVSIAAALVVPTARPLAAQAVAGVSSGVMPPAADHPVDFAADVVPIFQRSCYSCHGPDRQRSDYRLDEKASALGGGEIGGAIKAGDSKESPLILYVAGLHPEIRMPQRGEKLSAAEIGVLRRWIDDGAKWPAELERPREPREPPAGEARDAALAGRADHWAYQPIVRPPLPPVAAAHWIETPVDAFVLARLEANGLHLAPPADRRTLLRRVTFDLTGLPPTEEEQRAFLSDGSPCAYEKVVDRLLASPRYGERWARRWIDLVHFAETHGNDQDRERRNAWPYRDWLIDSFNADKPYARFIQEQLAGDVLFPDDPQAIVALGFLAAGPWDESSQLNIVDDTLDKANARNLDRDDMVMTTMSTFVATTVHCARCHDHKFDPIAQRDYYRLQSVFAGVDRADRDWDVDPALHRQRQEILRRRLALKRAAADSPLLNGGPSPDPALARDLATWEESLRGLAAPWTVLHPDDIVSAGGQSAALQSDGSILFRGERPEVDTVTIAARVPLKGVTALRLDLLTDESLPFHGPGRQDNGNLHLNEITLAVVPAASGAPRAVTGAIDDAPHVVAIASASADFDQEGWTSAMAIDGKPETAWGIYPQVGRDHHAVFELAAPLDLGEGDALVVTLAQTHGGHHLIGKLRLAVTSRPPPVRATTLPEPIRAILALAPAARSPAQRADLMRHFLLRRIDEELAALPPPNRVYAGTTDFTPESNFTPALGPRPIRILTRGEISKPGAEVTPGALQCLAGFPGELAVADPTDEGQRRAALAKWIADRSNCLTWRTIVNRVWSYHFGRGLVATPSDFGAMGSAPSHPELLDWLAVWFLDHGGSFKQLDRLLVTSAAYRQSDRLDDRALAVDRDDTLLWRMARRRLDAESIRDAALQVAGVLDLTMGGPSVKQFVEKPGLHVTPSVDYESFAVDSPGMNRRSIYRFLFRTIPDPFMETMDCPDASQLAPTRGASFTALQALSLLNNPFMVRMSERIAARVEAESPQRCGQVDALYRLVLGRSPEENESKTVGAFVERRGLANGARLLLNSDEFLFVE